MYGERRVVIGRDAGVLVERERRGARERQPCHAVPPHQLGVDGRGVLPGG
jgi:hypothetical protein